MAMQKAASMLIGLFLLRPKPQTLSDFNPICFLPITVKVNIMRPLVRLSAMAMIAAVLYAGAVFADDTHYLVQVDGLNCPFCAYGIEKQLEKLDGVENVETELALGQISVEVANGVTLSEETVHEIIRDAGFTFKRMTQYNERQSDSGESE